MSRGVHARTQGPALVCPAELHIVAQVSRLDRDTPGEKRKPTGARRTAPQSPDCIGIRFVRPNLNAAPRGCPLSLRGRAFGRFCLNRLEAIESSPTGVHSLHVDLRLQQVVSVALKSGATTLRRREIFQCRSRIMHHMGQVFPANSTTSGPPNPSQNTQTLRTHCEHRDHRFQYTLCGAPHSRLSQVDHRMIH